MTLDLTVNDQKTRIDRNKIIEVLESENIEARPVWKPMHLQPLYNKCDYVKKGTKDISAKLFEKGICLPSGSNLSKKDQSRIIDIILSLVK